jgi:hypothetical protein
MGLAIAAFILIIISFFLRKINFITRLKIGAFLAVFLFLTLGLYHLYSYLTLIGKEEANAAIDESIARCGKANDILYMKVLGINAREIYSQAAAKAAIEPVKKIQARMYSEYLIQTGQGGFSDALNILHAYILENLLLINSEENIEQIAIKAGIKALEETTCKELERTDLLESVNQIPVEKDTNEPTQTQNLNSDASEAVQEKDLNTNIGEPPQTQSPDIDNNRVLRLENKELNTNEPAVPIDLDEYTYEQWKHTQDKIKNSPEKFISECIENDVEISQRYGGLKREEVLAQGTEDSCKKELDELRKCMSMSIDEGHQCYLKMYEGADI